MILYFLFALVAFFTCIFVDNNNKSQRKVVYSLCLLMFILTGTRWQYGGDWSNYFGYFQQINKLRFDDSGFEYGWVIISFIMKKVAGSYVLFQFLMAGVLFFCIYNCIKYLSPVPLLSYLVFFALENGGVNYVRTSIVTSIVIYSYIYVVKGDLLKFLLIITFACSIHLSAFIAYPVYWIYRANFNYSKYLIVGGIVVVFFYIAGKSFLSDFSGFGSYVQYKLDKYITAQESGEYFGGNFTVEKALVNHIIKKTFVFFFLIMYCRKELTVNSIFRGFTNIYIVGTIFYCSVVPIALQFARTSGYYDGVEILICAYIYKTIKNMNARFFFLLFTLTMNFIRLHGHIDPHNPLIYNYHNILLM